MIHRNNLKLCICILHMYTCTSNYRTLFRLLFCRSNKLFGRHLDHQSLILSFLSSFLISDLNFSFAKLFENLPFSYQPPNNLRMRESKLFWFTNLSVPETGLLLSWQSQQQPSLLSWQSVALDSRGREFDSQRRPWSCIFRNWSRLSLRKFTHSQNILIVYLY